MSNKSIILHLDSLSFLDEIDNELAGVFIKAIRDYKVGNPIGEIPIELRYVLPLFFNQFDRDGAKYDRISELRRNYGRMGGIKTAQNTRTETGLSPTIPSPSTDRRSTIEKTVIENIPKKEDFIRYFVDNGQEAGYGDEVYSYYESIKWVGIIDWRKTVNALWGLDKSESKNKKMQVAIPAWEEFWGYYKQEIYSIYPVNEFDVRAKYDQWVECKWVDGNGNKIKNWKTKLKNTAPHFKRLVVGVSNQSSVPSKEEPDYKRESWV